MGRFCIVAVILVLSGLPVSAAQPIAVFPIDMILQKSPEDFYFGQSKPTKDEQRRLELAHDSLQRYVEADGRYSVTDLKDLAKEIEEAAPLYECNGCELDLARKVNVKFVMTSVIDKISETHLSLTVSVVDVEKSKLLSKWSVLIQGNTDEAWLHGVKWLAKNRLFAKEQAQ
jgi:uncharacterized protein DUF2380